MLGLRKRCVIRMDVDLDWPRDGLQGRARCGTAFASIVFVFGEMRRRTGVIRPALGQRGEGIVSGCGGAKALGWQVKALFFAGRVFALCGLLQRGLRTLTSRLGIHHQPTLGHPIVAQRQRLIAGVVIACLPGIPLERLANAARAS